MGGRVGEKEIQWEITLKRHISTSVWSGQPEWALVEIYNRCKIGNVGMSSTNCHKVSQNKICWKMETKLLDKNYTVITIMNDLLKNTKLIFKLQYYDTIIQP